MTKTNQPRRGRDLREGDPNEQILGDDEANGFLARPYRLGYKIKV